MHGTPHGRGHVYIHTQPRRKAQADFSVSPVSSAPLKTPNHPLGPEPDTRPPLTGYDVRPRKSARIISYALRRGTLRFEPEFYSHGKAIYDQDQARITAKRISRTTFPYVLARSVFATPGWDGMARKAAKGEWLKQFSLPRKPKPQRTGRFSRLDAKPNRWRIKPQHPHAEQVETFLSNGGEISYFPVKDAKGKPMRQRIGLSHDSSGAWRVELDRDGKLSFFAFFDEFTEAQKFALEAARRWQKEYWTKSDKSAA